SWSTGTGGRAGLCTGTGDAILVIDCHGKLRTAANGNVMAKHMPALVTARFFAALPHRHKVLVAGNHDFGFRVEPSRPRVSGRAPRGPCARARRG
ncbi:MAG: hypothetical protein ABI134_26540, partial [Byssovorax sp.]